MPRRQGVCVFTGPTSVTQTLSPTHREGGATLLAPGHVWWPGVQPPLDLNQSPPTQLGQPLPGCTSDAHIGYPRADRVWNGGAASPPPRSFRPCAVATRRGHHRSHLSVFLSAVSAAGQTVGTTRDASGCRWVLSGKFCPSLGGIGCLPPTNTLNSHHAALRAQADTTHLALRKWYVTSSLEHSRSAFSRVWRGLGRSPPPQSQSSEEDSKARGTPDNPGLERYPRRSLSNAAGAELHGHAPLWSSS